MLELVFEGISYIDMNIAQTLGYKSTLFVQLEFILEKRSLKNRSSFQLSRKHFIKYTIQAKKEPVKKEPKVKKEPTPRKPKKEDKEEKKKKKGKEAWETDSEDEESDDAMSADGFTSE